MPFIYGTPCLRVLIFVVVVFLWHTDEFIVYVGSYRDAFLCLTLDPKGLLALGIKLVGLFPLKLRTGRDISAHTTSLYGDLHFFPASGRGVLGQ